MALLWGPGPVTRSAASPGESPVILLQGQNISIPVTPCGFVSWVYLVGSLVDSSGHILIPGIYDHVAPLTEEEKKNVRSH